jgi:hypothetical protein
VSLRSLFRWVTLSFVGLAVFLVSVVGYSIGGAFVMFAALKLIWPHSTGLWKNSYPDGTWSLYLTCSTGQPPHGQELLGWWLIPIGLFLGGGLLFLSFLFGT